jgi:hypothetical protein
MDLSDRGNGPYVYSSVYTVQVYKRRVNGSKFTSSRLNAIVVAFLVFCVCSMMSWGERERGREGGVEKKNKK